MYITSDLIVDLWDLVKDYIPANKKQAISDEWLKTFESHGTEPEILAETGTHESDFEKACEEYIQDHDQDQGYDANEDE